MDGCTLFFLIFDNVSRGILVVNPTLLLISCFGTLWKNWFLITSNSLSLSFSLRYLLFILKVWLQGILSLRSLGVRNVCVDNYEK